MSEGSESSEGVGNDGGEEDRGEGRKRGRIGGKVEKGRWKWLKMKNKGVWGVVGREKRCKFAERR